MTTKTTNDIKLRNKFAKLIESDEARQAYINACEKFCGLTENASSAILWRLTYSTDAAAEDLRQLGLNPEEISPEILTPLKNELHSQYKQRNPKVWEVDVPEACVEAFTDLKNHTGEIVAAKVLDRCMSRVSTCEEDMERILFLLNSNMENRHFGGLRELYFSSEQAAYLKPFHMQVHNLFVAVYERFKQQSRSGDSFTNKPFEGLSERLNQAGVTLSDDELPFEISTPAHTEPGKVEVQPETQPEPPVEAPAEAPVEACKQSGVTKFTALTVENILANKEVFSSFANNNDFASLEQIKALGFDLNAIIGREHVISDVLWYAAVLQDAQSNLDKAAEALSN